MLTVDVCETFASIQGESSYAGLPCFFIRLSGCNLRCRYCDTRYAYEPGRPVAVAELVGLATAERAPLVELTGGEPLLQPAAAALARDLVERSGKTVLVETNGSRDLSVLPPGAVAILDVKCPGSGEAASFDAANVARLKPRDEVKFVLADRADYDWAKAFVGEHRLVERCAAVFFSPARGFLDAADLAGWLVADGLPVRLQVQLHRAIGIR